MKVLICGKGNIGETNPFADYKHSSAEISRASSQRKFVSNYISKLHLVNPITEVISGNEGGVEEIGIHWAMVNDVPTVVWNRLSNVKSQLIHSFKSLIIKKKVSRSNKESLHERNKRMIAGSKPDLVLIFGRGETTIIIMEGAKSRGFEVIEVEVPNFDKAKLFQPI